MIDKLKLAVAFLILMAGVIAYYQLPSIMGADVSIVARVGAVLVAIVVAFAVAASSQYGAALIDFSKGSRTELRKMIWPSHQERSQMTIIVLVLVVIVALFLWLIDASVFKLVYNWLLGLDN